jgi:hypothetical protein
MQMWIDEGRRDQVAAGVDFAVAFHCTHHADSSDASVCNRDVARLIAPAQPSTTDQDIDAVRHDLTGISLSLPSKFYAGTACYRHRRIRYRIYR